MGFLIGALLITAVIMGGIYQARLKRGDDRLGPPAIYATWVMLAMYGVGTREDYRMDEAVWYPIAAFTLYALAFVARYMRRRAPAKVPVSAPVEPD